MNPEAPLDLSVVTMLYRSEAWTEEFYRRTVRAAEALTSAFEIIFVNDGSPDRAGEIARGIAARDPRVVVVDLSRNFGHHPAAVAGLSHSRGRRVFIIDADLEEQPEWLGQFAEEMERTGADVVFGVNRGARRSAFRRWTGSLFWVMFNALAEVKVPPEPCTVRLMSRRYVDALLTLPDRALFLAGNYAWVGFEQRPRPVQKQARPTRSSYTLAHLLALFVEAVTSFTSYPLRLIFLSGLWIAAIALGLGGVLVVWKLSRPEAISLGWSSIIVSIWFLGGLIIAFVGVIGIYLSKIFTEAKGRPLYVVRDVVRAARPMRGAD